MLAPTPDGWTRPWTANGPAPEPLGKPPPRSRAPGPWAVVEAPERHMRSSLKAPQPGQAVEAGTQTATHSSRLPTMSLAPWFEMQPGLAPVLWTEAVETLQVVESGVPATACCHSALVGRRLPELASAWRPGSR